MDLFLRLKADISKLPVETFMITRGGDNRDYYMIDFVVGACLKDTHTTFVIFYNGTMYSTVDAAPLFERFVEDAH